MTRIYRYNTSEDNLVATFRHIDDAVRCFKSMAYNLGDKLIMVSNGECPQTRPHNCCINSMGQYVLTPTLFSDRLS